VVDRIHTKGNYGDWNYDTNFVLTSVPVAD